jgi:hypothetical protein
LPLELAPFFFGARGEWMMATILPNLLYPIAAVLLILPGIARSKRKLAFY